MLNTAEDGKVILEHRPHRGWIAPGFKELPIYRSLPFFQSRYGAYLHRVRSGTTYLKDDGTITHITFRLWCGSIGSLSKGALFAKPKRDHVLCATCHGRAIGAGVDGERIINNEPVIFRPRGVI